MVDRTKEMLKNAVATNLGWVNPDTGELLVSIRGLPGAIQWTKGKIAKAETPKANLDAVELTGNETIGGIDAEVEFEAVMKMDVAEVMVEAPKADKPAKKATKKTTKKTKAE